jgi:hypothetical protein
MGIMLWFRLAMIQSELASSSRTISTQGHASHGRQTMIEFLGRAFAPVATILSFIAGWTQPVDATPLHSNAPRWNGMHMEGHARTRFMPQQKAKR